MNVQASIISMDAADEEFLMTSRMTGLAACAVLFLAAGCVTTAPTADTTDPDITLIVSEGTGGNIFRSGDGELPVGKDCINVPGTPTQIVMVAGDAGGLQSASVGVSFGTIDPSSVEILPRAPEASFAIRTEAGSDFLDIILTPPGPGTVRTGATAIFRVDGDLPIGISTGARDYAGNSGAGPSIELRLPEDAVVCRGEQ